MKPYHRGEIGPPSSVLFFCLAGLGDTIMATPAIRAMRRALPTARVAALTMLSGSREILMHNPDLDDLIHFDFMREGFWRSIAFMRTIRRQSFDAVIATYPSNRIEYNLLLLLAGARMRVGHRYNHSDWTCGNMLKNVAVLEEDDRSNIDENLRLIEMASGFQMEATAPQVFLCPEHHQFADGWFAAHTLGGTTIIGIHPGCDARKNHANRRWPAARFVALGQELIRDPSVRILVFGGPEEETLKREVVAGIGPASVAVDAPSLLASCAVLSRCCHTVTNDSGLMHLAGALGVPTTAVFGPTNRVWARNPHCERTEIFRDLPCQPCFYYSPRHLNCRYDDFRCVHEVTVETVLDTVLQAVHRHGASSRAT